MNKQDRSDAWRSIALTAFEKFKAQDDDNERAFAYAYAMQTAAWLYGWDSPEVDHYYNKVLGTKNVDGGFGLGYIYDCFGDGTKNPASTTYTVTLADHVGPPFLEGYKAGKVPKAEVQNLIDMLVAMPRLDSAAGRCVTYSNHPNDKRTGYCVHNVNAGAAYFLLQVKEAGFSIPWYLVSGITLRTVSAFNFSTKFWPYRDGTATIAQDTDHNSYTAESMYYLAYPIGYQAIYNHMANEYSDKWAQLAHMRLTGVKPIGNDNWTPLGDRWLPEASSFVDTVVDSTKIIQSAYFSTRNSLRSLE